MAACVVVYFPLPPKLVGEADADYYLGLVRCPLDQSVVHIDAEVSHPTIAKRWK